MIECRVAGIRLIAHPLMLLLPLLSLALGLRVETPALLLSLFVHEAGHLLSARLAGVRVTSLTAMPFGCGMQLGNLYALNPGRVFAVAAGGPLASLALLFVDGALVQWGLLSPAFALALLRVTLTLLLFNLLPALPLDGGRMLVALCSRRMGRDRAVRLGALLGYATAAGLLLGTAWLWYRTRLLNLTLTVCALFIVKGIQEDRSALGDVAAVSLLNALRRDHTPVAMRVCAIDDQCDALTALRHTASDAATLFAVYHDDRLTAFTDERALMALAMKNPAAKAAELIKDLGLS